MYTNFSLPCYHGKRNRSQVTFDLKMKPSSTVRSGWPSSGTCEMACSITKQSFLHEQPITKYLWTLCTLYSHYSATDVKTCICQDQTVYHYMITDGFLDTAAAARTPSCFPPIALCDFLVKPTRKVTWFNLNTRQNLRHF